MHSSRSSLKPTWCAPFFSARTPFQNHERRWPLRRWYHGSRVVRTMLPGTAWPRATGMAEREKAREGGQARMLGGRDGFTGRAPARGPIFRCGARLAARVPCAEASFLDVVASPRCARAVDACGCGACATCSGVMHVTVCVSHCDARVCGSWVSWWRWLRW